MRRASDRLTAMSAGRNHPLNAAAAYATNVAPLILLGAGDGVLTALGTFTAVHGMLQHCNVDLRHGVLSYVLATADVHRLHHSLNRAESNTNFGNNTVIWDHVFRTFALPHRRGPAAVGLDDLAIPDNVWVHLALPFTLRRWARPKSEP